MAFPRHRLLLVFVWLKFCTALDPGDKAVLEEFYASTDGANWDITWDLGVELCGQEGVICGGDFVEHLDLVSNNLVGTLAPEIGALSKLTQLDLAINMLHGSIPAEFANLNNLTILYLHGNQLYGKFPVIVTTMPALRSLNIHQNNFGGRIPPEIGNFPAIEYLNIMENNFKNFPSEIGQLTSLIQLHMSGNLIEGTIPTVLGLLPLTRFTASRNYLFGTIPTEIFTTGMRKMALYSNYLEGTIPTEVGLSPQLEWLTFHDNRLTGIVPLSFMNLTRLEKLKIAGTNCFTECDVDDFDMHPRRVKMTDLLEACSPGRCIGGKDSSHILENVPHILTDADCKLKCVAHPKCDKYSWRTKGKLCKLFSSDAILDSSKYKKAPLWKSGEADGEMLNRLEPLGKDGRLRSSFKEPREPHRN